MEKHNNYRFLKRKIAKKQTHRFSVIRAPLISVPRNLNDFNRKQPYCFPMVSGAQIGIKLKSTSPPGGGVTELGCCCVLFSFFFFMGCFLRDRVTKRTFSAGQSKLCSVPFVYEAPTQPRCKLYSFKFTK